MIEEPPLLRVAAHQRRPSAAQIAAFQGVPTGYVIDARFGAGALSSEIRALGEGNDLPRSVAGPALTADPGPADIMATIAALNYVQQGDILAIAFSGHQGCAAAGDRVTGMLRNGGGAGLITDGPVRDYTGLVEVGLPIWCTGLTPASPFTNGPGTVALPVQIGGQRVETGDMLVADRDGVVHVPFAELDAVIARLAQVAEAEAALDAKVAEGLAVPDAVSDWLASDRVVFVDG